MQISAEIKNPLELTEAEIGAMYALMTSSFLNTSFFTFRRDLKKKNVVILLRNAQSGELKGFSNQQIFVHCFQGLKYRVVFSGDTIIAKDAWGHLTLPFAWGEWMYRLWSEEPSTPLLWMLISKGFRTYRFLPAFFNTFFPSCRTETPSHLKQLIDSLGKEKFPRHYNPLRGVIHGAGWNYFLCEELAQVAEQYEGNQHVEFFLRTNPGYARGDELVCLTFFSPDNLKPFYRRTIERKMKGEFSTDAKNVVSRA